MAKTVDQEAIEKAKALDIAKPPVKEIGHLEFPKMLYKHPKDKTKEHKTHIVNDKSEHAAAIKAGYVEKPHIPETPVVAEEE